MAKSQIVHLPYWACPLGSTAERQIVTDKLRLRDVNWIQLNQLDGLANTAGRAGDILDLLQELGHRPLGMQARNWFAHNQQAIPEGCRNSRILFPGDVFKYHPDPNELVSYEWMRFGYRHFEVLNWDEEKKLWETGGYWFHVQFTLKDWVACLKP